MTTAYEVITGALRAIQVLESGEAPSGAEANDALAALNRMIHGWRNKNVDVNHVDLALNDDLRLEDRHHEGVINLLAIRLAPEYEKPVSTAVATLAAEGWRGIQAHFTIVPQATLEGLEYMPSRRFGGWY